MIIPPEYQELPNGTLKRIDGAVTDYTKTYWGHEGRSTIDDQCFNVHGFVNDAGETKAESVLKHCRGESLLEIGCAPGVLMKLARERGYECTGVEPCADHVKDIERISGCMVINGLFEDIEFAQEYHSIAALDLIEHLANPGAFVEKALSILSPGGRLILMLPALLDDGIFREQDFCPEHLWIFSEKHLREWLNPIVIERWHPGHVVVIVEKGEA